MKSPTILLITLLFIGCTKHFDKKAATQQILELHHLQRDVHFQKMATEFIDLLALDHISVNRGKVSQSSREENIARMDAYFSQVEFEQWDDAEPPIIRFSDDGSMAYTTVEKDVVLTYTSEIGQTLRDSTRFAWVAIYKRYAGEWKIDCVGSTNTPSVSQTLDRPDGFTLVSKANCQSPQGNYTTEIHSKTDGYMLFKQVFGDREQVFYALIKPDGSVYNLSENNEIGEPLPPAAKTMIRGHDFHMISLRPESFFGELVRKEETNFHGFDCVEYSGMDEMKRPVNFFYDRQSRQLRGLSLINPMNTEETIEIIYKKYEETAIKPLARTVEIIQAQRDTFRFEFEEILVNNNTFEDLDL